MREKKNVRFRLSVCASLCINLNFKQVHQDIKIFLGFAQKNIPVEEFYLALYDLKTRLGDKGEGRTKTENQTNTSHIYNMK